MTKLRLPRVDKTMIVAVGQITVNGRVIPIEVRFSPRMQIFWQTSAIQNEDGSELAADKVSKQTTTIYPSHTAPASYNQVTLQTLMDAVTTISDALRN